jgi:hypothetical protein
MTISSAGDEHAMIAMAAWKISLIVVAILAIGHILFGMIANFITAREVRRQPSKSPSLQAAIDEGLVIFVEGIRWLGIRWDLQPAVTGLRKAGYGGEFEYWKWHSTWRGWVVLPVIMAPALLEREARRLADYIVAQRAANPSRPIHLMGCSCGTFVVLRALEMLPAGVNVQAAALLAGAFDPRRELDKSLEHVAGPVVVTSSMGDWLILGLGTLIFGTADRRHSFSAGMVGLPASSSKRPIQIKWRPAMIAYGHMGTHFISSEFIAKFVAPAMAITSRSCRIDARVAGGLG